MPAKPYAVESAVQAVLEHLTESQPRFAQHRPGEFIDARLAQRRSIRAASSIRLYGGAGRQNNAGVRTMFTKSYLNGKDSAIEINGQFRLVAEFEPQGDQPKAIEKLVSRP